MTIPPLADAIEQDAYQAAWQATLPSHAGSLPTNAIASPDHAGTASIAAPQAVCLEAWCRVARDLDLVKLARMTTVIGLPQVPGLAESILGGHSQGRTIVDVGL